MCERVGEQTSIVRLPVANPYCTRCVAPRAATCMPVLQCTPTADVAAINRSKTPIHHTHMFVKLTPTKETYKRKKETNKCEEESFTRDLQITTLGGCLCGV